ncbi:unnamed protein product [[Candida] boidinii]|nr:unnamed protein product [[Candida] boidinii]
MVTGSAMDDDPFYYLYIPARWNNFNMIGYVDDHYVWDGSKFQMQVDNVFPASSEYELFFTNDDKTASLDFQKNSTNMQQSLSREQG